MDGVLSAEEIDALLGALSTGEIDIPGAYENIRGRAENAEGVSAIKGTLFEKLREIADFPGSANVKLKTLKLLEEEVRRTSAIVEKENPMCPECKDRYRKNSYEFFLRDEETTSGKVKKIFYSVCPKKHVIRLGESPFPHKDNEVLLQKEIDELVKILNEIDYGYID